MIIVLEGPDESGKTTLAKALLGYAETQDLDPSYVKSPAGKSVDWEDEWNFWVLHQAYHEESNALIVMDRAPEISEVVYTWALSRPSRVSFPLSSLIEWSSYSILYVNCLGTRGMIDSEHQDPFGQHIQWNHERVCLGYDFVSKIVHGHINRRMVNYFRYDAIRQKEDFYTIVGRINGLYDQDSTLYPPVHPMPQYIVLGEKYVQERDPDVPEPTPEMVGEELSGPDAMATDYGDD